MLRRPSVDFHEEVEPATSRLRIALPIRTRKCTDLLFLVLILGTWLAMTVIGMVGLGLVPSSSLSAGNPEYLLHGVDYEGNICGVDSAVKDLPYKWQPNFLGGNPSTTGQLVPALFAVCSIGCPRKGAQVQDPYEVYGSWEAQVDSMIFLKTCLYRAQERDSTSAVTIISDFVQAAVLIALLGFFSAVLVSLLYLFLTTLPLVLRGLVWFCATLVFTLLCSGAYFFLDGARQEQHRSDGNLQSHTEIVLMNFVGSVLVILTVIWVSVIFFTRDRIALAIGLIRESAEALISMPILCVSPVLQTMLFAGFSCLWMYYCVYLVSSGDINTHVDDTTGLTFKTVDFDKNTQHAIVFMVFGWFWSVGFIEAMGQIITSHSVVSWYFADRRQIIDSNQVLYSTVFCARYHCGTAAMGSLVIAIIRMIRMTLEYIKMRLAYNSNSKIAKYVACYLSCIMNIFEKGIKFLNKHAYVQCAIFGTPFFTSAGRAYFLLVRNFGRLAAVTVVGDFVILVGKLSISLLCAGVGYLYMKTYMRRELNGFVLPTLFIAFIAFYTATMFLGVLSATADTLLQACIVDEEMSIGKAESESNSLRELIGIREGRWKDTFSFASQDGERPSEYDDYENGQDYSLASFDPHVDDSASSSKSFYSGKIEQSALNFFNSSKVPSKKVQRQNFANSLELNTLQQYRSRKNNDDAASTISSLSTNTNTRSVFGFNLGGGTKQLKRSSSDDALNDDMSIDNIYFHNASTDIIGMATSRREENRHATHRRSTSGGSNIFPDNTSENGSFFNEVQQQNRLLKGTLRQSSSFYLDAGRSQLNRSSSSGFTDSPRNASPRNVLTIDVRKGMGSPNGSGGSSFEASSPLAPHTANTIREPASRMMSQMNQISGPTQTNPLTFSMANSFSRPSSTWTLEQSSDPCSVERNRNKSDGKKLNEVQAAEPTTTHPPSNTAAIFYSNPFDEDKI